MTEDRRCDDVHATAISRLLDGLDVPHRLVEHRPIFTLEEGLDSGVAARLGLEPGNLVKCLLLHDAHDAMAFVVAAGEARIDLRAVARGLGTARLSFVPPDRMRDVLGSEPGSASLFDLMDNPQAGEISVAVDDRIPSLPSDIGFHAGGNTRTVLFPAAALPQVVSAVAPTATLMPVQRR